MADLRTELRTIWWTPQPIRNQSIISTNRYEPITAQLSKLNWTQTYNVKPHSVTAVLYVNMQHYTCHQHTVSRHNSILHNSKIKKLTNKKAVLSQRRPRKCAMHPIYGCHENFRESLTTPMTTFHKIFHGFLFRLTLWICVQNLKSIAIPVPETIGVTPKICAVPGYAHAPSSPKFLMYFSSDASYECTCQISSS